MVLGLVAADDGALAALDAALRGRGRIDPARLAIVVGPGWAGASRHRDDTAREAAAAALVRMGRPAMPLLVAALREDRSAVRCCAARALGAMGPSAEDAAPALVALLGAEDEDLLDAALDALIAIGPGATPALIRALDHRDARVRLDACVLLEDLGPHARAALPALRRLSRDQAQAPLLRDQAAAAADTIDRTLQAHRAANLLLLAAAGPLHALPFAPTEGADSGKKVAGRQPFANRGPKQARWVGLGLLTLKLLVLIGSAVAAGYLGLRKRPEEPEAAPDPVTVRLSGLANPDPGARAEAARGLAEMGPAVLPRLLPALVHPDWRVREAASLAVRLMGPSIGPDLGAALGAPNKPQRDGAAVALVELGPAALPAVEAALQSQQPAARASACLVAAQLGPVARPLLPALRDALADSDPDVRQYAAEAVWVLESHST